MQIKNFIYLDNSATTKVDPRVLKEMLPYFSEEYGNASSLHQLGLDNRVVVDRVQAKIGRFLSCNKNDVYFTSGATESNNMAILGLIKALKGDNSSLHIIVSQIEHDAILEPCQELEKQGVEVTYLPVNKEGLVEIDRLKKSIRPNTVLVSIMYVNNEIGTIEPIIEIGELIKSLNQKRKNKIYFHSDVTQALNYCDCDVNKLGVDMMSFSGHKIYGPKGIGVFYMKDKTPFYPQLFGGHQQNNIRPGTYNLPGIVGLGFAIELIEDKKSINKESRKIKKLRDYLITEVRKKISDVSVSGGTKNRAPNNASFIFRGVEGESIVLMLSEKGIATSTGSACSSGSLKPSHVLTAIGVKPELAHGSLRVTLGRFTVKKDIDKLIRDLPPIIDKLRKMSPLK